MISLRRLTIVVPVGVASSDGDPLTTASNPTRIEQLKLTTVRIDNHELASREGGGMSGGLSP